MREEKLGFGIIFRIGISLLPILFGYSLPAVIWCSFSIAMSFIVYGPITSVVSSLCAVCISMFFCGFFGEGAKLEGLFIALQAIFCAAACIYAVTGRKKFFHGVWLASIGYLIPSFMSVKNAASSAGQSVAQYLTEAPFEMAKVEVDALASNPMLQLGQNEIEAILELVRTAFMIVVPSTMIISSVVVGYLVAWCVSARLRSLDVGFKHSFSEIKLSRLMVIITGLSLVLSFVGPAEVRAVSLNVFIVLISFALFAGVSFIDYLLRKWVQSGVLRGIIHFAVFFTLSAFVGVVYVILALFDAFFDFRKIYTRGQVCETEE